MNTRIISVQIEPELCSLVPNSMELLYYASNTINSIVEKSATEQEVRAKTASSLEYFGSFDMKFLDENGLEIDLELANACSLRLGPENNLIIH